MWNLSEDSSYMISLQSADRSLPRGDLITDIAYNAVKALLYASTVSGKVVIWRLLGLQSTNSSSDWEAMKSCNIGSAVAVRRQRAVVGMTLRPAVSRGVCSVQCAAIAWLSIPLSECASVCGVWDGVVVAGHFERQLQSWVACGLDGEDRQYPVRDRAEPEGHGHRRGGTGRLCRGCRAAGGRHTAQRSCGHPRSGTLISCALCRRAGTPHHAVVTAAAVWHESCDAGLVVLMSHVRLHLRVRVVVSAGSGH